MSNQDQNSDFIQPLKNRPDLDPDPNFVRSLKNELLQQSQQIEKTKMKFTPIIIGTFTLAICFVLTFIYINDPKNEVDLAGDDLSEPSINEEPTFPQIDIEILENEEIDLIFDVNYGENSAEIAFPQIKGGGSDFAPSSFFVKDDIFYILDNSGKKVVITTQNQHLFTIQLNEDLWVNDIFVDAENNIYVLAVREVYKFSGDGNLLETYPIHQYNLSFNEISADAKKNIFVKDFQNRIINVLTDERVAKKDVNHLFQGVSNKIVTQNQIVERVTTMAEDIPLIMAEMHLYVRNEEGELLGGVREPHELNEYYSDQNIRIADGKIIYMSAGKDKVSFYELIPGVNFTEKLQERIEKYKEDESVRHRLQTIFYDEFIEYMNTLDRGDYIGFAYSTGKLHDYLLKIYQNDFTSLDFSYSYKYHLLEIENDTEQIPQLIEKYHENVDFKTLTLTEMNHQDSEIEITLSYQNKITNEIDYLIYSLNYGEHGINDLSVFD